MFVVLLSCWDFRIRGRLECDPGVRLVFANFLKPRFPRVQKGGDVDIYILEWRRVR